MPDLPERGRPTPMPLVAMVVPLLMGAVLFAITKSPFSIIFMLMMPVMMAGTYWEARRQQKKDFAQAMEDFREDLAILSARIRTALDREGDVRRSEHPSGEQCLTAVRDRSALLWTRRRDVPGYGELRLGLGTRPSRSSIRMPMVGRSKAEAWIEVSEQLHGLEVVPDVPVVATPLTDGAVGVCGPRAGALGAARSLLMQATALHSPAELVVCSFASGSSARRLGLPQVAAAHHLAAQPGRRRAPRGQRAVVLGARRRPRGPRRRKAGAVASVVRGPVSRAAPPSAQESAVAARPTVLVLVESDAPIDRSRLVAIAERGHRHGVVVVWVAESQSPPAGVVPHLPRRRRRPHLARGLRAGG